MPTGNSPTYGLTHLAVSVQDIERTMLFYTSVFDMEVMYHEKDMVQLTTPGCNDIIVFQENLNDSTGTSGGIAHFGFRLKDPKDIELMKQKVVKAGGAIRDEGEFVPGLRIFFSWIPMGMKWRIWYELLPV
jgi:predicted enzyme related to lactoylglutathione lyase